MGLDPDPSCCGPTLRSSKFESSPPMLLQVCPKNSPQAPGSAGYVQCGDALATPTETWQTDKPCQKQWVSTTAQVI